jgi:hypothetical protein
MIKTHRIGIDFDNTIVSYGEVFYKYALKLKLILKEVRKNKQAVRDAIRALPQGNDKWTRLQGLVYGRYMGEAELVEGVGDFFEACRRYSFKVSIISHKTVYPAMGPRVNLQAAAKRWLKDRGFLSRFGLTENDVIFEETLKGKFEQIAGRKCAYFIDDLKEILVHPDFPKGVAKILYSRQGGDGLPADIMRFKDWYKIKEYFFG